MKILVTDGETRSALAITRSLGKKKHLIFVGEKIQPSLAGVSKYCFSRFVYPDPAKQIDNFIDTLIRIIQENHIEVILPVTDITTMLITENKKTFKKYCKVPFSDTDTISLAARKDKLISIAKQLGIPVPKTVFIYSQDEVLSLSDGISFPVVVKPHSSRIRVKGGWHSAAVTYANSSEELTKIIKNKHKAEFPLLLQERIYGTGIGVFTCYNQGKMVALFSHRRIREKPPSGGVSVLRESIPVSPVAKEFTERLLNYLDWHGVAMVEFKLDQRDNVPKLMEINGRFWGSLQLAIDSGVDFPGILIKTLEAYDVAPTMTYRNGVRLRWFWGDVDLLLMILFSSRKKLYLPPDYNGRLYSVLDFLKLWGKDLHYEVLSLDDPRPWIHETIHWFKRNH